MEDATQKNDADPQKSEEDLQKIQLSLWGEVIEAAEEMVPLLGRLYRKSNIVVKFCGKQLNNIGAVDIVKTHQLSTEILGTTIEVKDTLALLKTLADLGLNGCKLEIGDLALLHRTQHQSEPLEYFLKNTLHAAFSPPVRVQQDVVLYGFGRIGRLLCRILLEKAGGGDKLRLRAVVVRVGKDSNDDLEKRASLLELDSVHGPLNGSIKVDKENNALVVNGNIIRFISGSGPDSMDYTQYGIKDAIVIDNTGALRDRKGLSKHLKSKGVSKVILTAPAKGDVPNLVAGVNSKDAAEAVKNGENVFAAASCTTNAVVPFLSVLHNHLTIDGAHIETVHSFTNDQNLIDNMHDKSRRGRSAVLNMVITETGAKEAVAKSLPDLAAHAVITGNSIRVPTPDVSLAILMLTVQKETTKKDLNAFLKAQASRGPLEDQLDYSESQEVVSSDFVGNRSSGVLDAPSTIVTGKRVNLYIWYDNEFGYSCQVIRLAQVLGGVLHPRYP